MSDTPPVTFDFPTWTAMFPEFSALTAAQGAAYFMGATDICANSCSNPIFLNGNLASLLYLATSHVAWLRCPKDENGNPAAQGAPASELVGRISSASEGSVSVQTDLDKTGNSSALDAYLQQTKYGLEDLAKIAQFRTARYMPNPTRVATGVFPGAFGGRFRR
jgi:hypothetical protein